MSARAAVILFIYFLSCAAYAKATIDPETKKVDQHIHKSILTWRTTFKSNLPRWLNAQRGIINQKIFYIPSGNKKDAGLFLNSRLKWLTSEGNEVGLAAIAKFEGRKPSDGLIKVSDDMLKALQSKKQKINWANINLKWMSQLVEYDHWDLYKNSPWENLEKIDYTSPLWPKLQDLVICAQFRLRQGAEQKQMAAAWQEVYHLAQLLNSTETILGLSMATKIFSAMAGYSNEFKKAGLNNIDIVARQNMSLAKMFQSPLLDSISFKHISQFANSPGFCSALAEGGMGLLVYRSLLGKELQNAYKNFETFINSKNHPCRLALLRRAWAGDSKFIFHFQALPQVPLEKRKSFLEFTADLLSASERQWLEKSVNRPRWLYHVGYYLILKNTPAEIFKDI